MASGELVATDNSTEKRRWGDGSKVYTRRHHRKGLKETSTATANNENRNAADATTVNDRNISGDDNSEKNRNDNANDAQQSLQTLATDEANSSPHHQTPSRLDEAALDESFRDSRSIQLAVPSDKEAANENGFVKQVITRVNDRVKINLGPARSKSEIRGLKRKLNGELDQVRTLMRRIDAKEAELSGHFNTVSTVCYSHPQHTVNDVREMPRRLEKVNSIVGSIGHQQRLIPFNQLRVSVMDNNHELSEIVEKEKRTPKANQYYRNSEFLLGKDRLPPENKKVKSNSGKKPKPRAVYGYDFDQDRNKVFRNCSNLLQRLMKHKHGWVFNEPVNAKALGLYDYHDIIKHPMDLGTIKIRLTQNWYRFPREFAEDVRLTFRNAMTYNPKGQDVHFMAEQLSNIFEERWAAIEAEYYPSWRYDYGTYRDAGLTTPTSRKALHPLPPAHQMRYLDRSESMKTPVESNLKPKFAPVVRTPVPKKPKANDPNKRDMTNEEKQRLSINLQALPSEKLDAIVQIIKRRNTTLSQRDDEIEVDIDSVDPETLWELYRFVTNYKKSLSKNKRKAKLALQPRAEVGHAVESRTPVHAIVEAPKESEADIGNVSTTPVQRYKQGDNAPGSSSSSTSSSDSDSSSSDSDSDSSSASDSDTGHSPKT